ncbi:hypothetical protein N9086_03625 [Akkermansiaceae bacterium]|nr:hypothetical protein [Akkermansiaceae bacterium]MDB4515357.1 hypothetical protein [Akkermansiaceae bacterium]
MNKASFIDSINMAKAKRLMSAEIDSLLAHFKESSIPFDLELTSFSKTFGSQEDSLYDGGYSVICSVKNTNIEVQVLFGTANNEMIESLNKGDTLTEELKFVSYDSLYQRPIMGQVFSASSLNEKAVKKDQEINELTTSITSDLGANSEQSVSEGQLFLHRFQIICALRRRIEIIDQETVSLTPKSIGNPNAKPAEASTSPRTIGKPKLDTLWCPKCKGHTEVSYEVVKIRPDSNLPTVDTKCSSCGAEMDSFYTYIVKDWANGIFAVIILGVGNHLYASGETTDALLAWALLVGSLSLWIWIYQRKLKFGFWAKRHGTSVHAMRAAEDAEKNQKPGRDLALLGASIFTFSAIWLNSQHETLIAYLKNSKPVAFFAAINLGIMGLGIGAKWTCNGLQRILYRLYLKSKRLNPSMGPCYDSFKKGRSKR